MKRILISKFVIYFGKHNLVKNETNRQKSEYFHNQPLPTYVLPNHSHITICTLEQFEIYYETCRSDSKKYLLQCLNVALLFAK